MRWGGGHDRSGAVSQKPPRCRARRLATDTDRTALPSSESESTPASTTSAAEVAAQLRGFADELAELIAAVAGLASAEASLSLTAFLRMLGLRAVGVVLVALALALLAVAGTVVLAQVLGSAAAAMGLVALGALLGAALALWRSAVWRERISFGQTRAALGAKSPPSAGPAP